MEKTENYLKIIIMMFFANARLILISMVFFGIVSILIVILAPPVYHITGSVIVKAKKISAPAESAQERTTNRSLMPATIEDVHLETKVVSNPELVKTSISQLIQEGVSFDSLLQNWNPLSGLILHFFKKNRDETSAPVSVADSATQVIIDKLKTVIVPGANLISVEMNTKDPVLGARILNTIFDNYLQFRLQIFTDPSALDLFADQAKNYKVALEDLEKKKLAILQKYRISDAKHEIVNQLNLLEIQKKELYQLEDGQLRLQREVEYLQDLISKYLRDPSNMYQPFPHDFGDEKIKNFSQQLDALLFNYYDALNIYQSDTEKIKLLESQIRKLWYKMINLVQTNVRRQSDEIETSKQIIAGKKSTIEQLIHRNQVISEGGFELTRIETEIALNRDNYEAFLRKFEEARIEQTSEVTQKSNVQILSRAAVPGTPIFPKRIPVLIIGLVTGFILGFSLAFIKEFFDHTFKAPWQVQQYLNLPVIGTVPYNRDAESDLP